MADLRESKFFQPELATEVHSSRLEPGWQLIVRAQMQDSCDLPQLRASSLAIATSDSSVAIPDHRENCVCRRRWGGFHTGWPARTTCGNYTPCDDARIASGQGSTLAGDFSRSRHRVCGGDGGGWPVGDACRNGSEADGDVASCDTELVAASAHAVTCDQHSMRTACCRFWRLYLLRWRLIQLRLIDCTR